MKDKLLKILTEEIFNFFKKETNDGYNAEIIGKKDINNHYGLKLLCSDYALKIARRIKNEA